MTHDLEFKSPELGAIYKVAKSFFDSNWISEETLVKIESVCLSNNYVRVFCDYSADPIWSKSGGMISLGSFPISRGLKLAIRAWAMQYDFTNVTDISLVDSGGFNSIDELKLHASIGLDIAKEIKNELPHYKVIYSDRYLQIKREAYDAANNRILFEYEVHI